MTAAAHHGSGAKPPVSACVRVRVPDAQVAAAREAIREHDRLPVLRTGRADIALSLPDGTLIFENHDVLLVATWRRGRKVRGRVSFPWRLVTDLPNPHMGARGIQLGADALLASTRALLERHLSEASLELGARGDLLALHRAAASAAVAGHGGWSSRTFVQHRSEWAYASIDFADRADLDPWPAEDAMRAMIAGVEGDRPIHAHVLKHHVAKTRRGVSFDIALSGLVEQVRPIDTVEAMRIAWRMSR